VHVGVRPVQQPVQEGRPVGRTINATAVRLDRPVEFEDVSMASVIFESGAVATVINSLLSPRELSRIRIDITPRSTPPRSPVLRATAPT